MRTLSVSSTLSLSSRSKGEGACWIENKSYPTDGEFFMIERIYNLRVGGGFIFIGQQSHASNYVNRVVVDRVPNEAWIWVDAEPNFEARNRGRCSEVS